MSIFRHQPDPAVTKDLERTGKEVAIQQEKSDRVLVQIQAVLEEKDRLLAEAVNQTGRAVRKRGRLNTATRSLQHDT